MNAEIDTTRHDRGETSEGEGTTRGAGSDPEYGDRIRRQFGHPTGALGWLLGHLMAAKNAERNRWVLSLLDIRPDAHVLEVGFGPGSDIRRAAELARDGSVSGVDHSRLMLRQASRRNAARIRAGQVELRLGSAEALPYPDVRFDRAFSINAVQFWADRARAVQELARVLKPGGRVAIAIQPRSAGATAATAQAWGRRLAEILPAGGFGSVRLETLPLLPVPVVCALGTR